MSIVYTEEEFIACLLVNGWVRYRNLDNSQFTYWQIIDRWFEEVWPERWLGTDSRDATQGQMHFKIQFWNWGREIFDVPPLHTAAPIK